MSTLLSLDWNRDGIGCIEADVAGEKVRVLRALRREWPAAIDRETDAPTLGDWLRQELSRGGVQAKHAIIVLPREEVVTRRLELPNAPAEELPELVRFQAATKSATPLDQLTLDFVPLPPIEGEPGIPALVATLDRKRVEFLQATCAAAGLELKSIQSSPFSVAEVAIRREQQRGDDPNVATMVIFQDEHRVELSILQKLGVVFTHHTRVDPKDERALRGTLAEINRSTVTFSQLMHSTVDVARVCLIHDGAVDPALEQALSERFSGQLHVIDPANDQALEGLESTLAVRLAGLAPAMGAIYHHVHAVVPSVDFLNPRRPPPKRDLRKERLIYWGIRGGAAAAVLGGAGWWYASHLGSQITALQKKDGDLTTQIAAGAGPKEAHGRIQSWLNAAVHPLDEIDRLNRLLPGTDRLLLRDLNVNPGQKGELAKLNGIGFAKSEADINDLFAILSANDYQVQPKLSERNNEDADYPYKFTLEVRRVPKPEPRPRGPAT
jgi:Tfp pilus assembly PilM family ATPase